MIPVTQGGEHLTFSKHCHCEEHSESFEELKNQSDLVEDFKRHILVSSENAPEVIWLVVIGL